ncbi:Tfp pilus assembly protein PilW [Luteitalea pratensis]|uniref:Tfp pilus assembly protein PilW n=1 Tax=Luteitalea pratensis TaxID=1855912 RepID=A0A143PSG5_LUTPR|nr:hypothetical protein [Luteitalea pratensis]AMY11575.1 Tfp pilus assembly protein PilW [Luteitalea pratensis]
MTNAHAPCLVKAVSACRGAALLELLIATCVALATLAIVSTALPPVLDVVRAVPEATDLQQRTRGTESVLADIVSSAGAGADLIGEGPLVHAVPALIPRRVLGSPDPAGTAWADRLSLVHVEARAAQAPLAAAVPAGSPVVLLTWHPACGTHPSCGFHRGDLVIVYAHDGAMVIGTLAGVQGLLLTLDTPPDQALALPATAAAVVTRTLSFDAVRQQLRLAANAAASQPLTDDVVGMRVRYYGTAGAPRWPAVAGTDTCAVLADGTPRLGLLGPVPGPPVELTVAALMDGPWCGAGVWRFDADLLRVKAVRIGLRLQAASPAVRGRASEWFARPGQARWAGQEVRDVELDTFVLAPNLAWTQ